MILWFTGQPGSGKTTLSKELIKKFDHDNVMHIDGDDLRDIIDNKDYSEKGRRENINLAMNLARFMENKGFIVIVSLVSPYRDLREELKMERNIGEFYLHTTEIRGKEDYFVENYEPPLHNFVDIDTDKPIEECVDEILDVYRQMAKMACRTSMVD
jgi:adenylylsulfate kinase|tara:strand:- start:590 stop:1057 length:468 start_codon:yes stop_codon:yes gene_type:complete